MSEDSPETLDTEASTAAPDLRARLAADVEEAATLQGIDAAALAALRSKLAGRIFNLVVAGEFKRGKSSTINALLGANVLPTGVVPLTSIVTVLRHGSQPSAEVLFEDGRREDIAIARLADYVTERANPKNGKRVRKAEVAYPAPWLGQGFRLVDTPGIGSAYSHNTDLTRAYLPQADAVIFVASVEQPVSHSELEFLAGLRAQAGKVFCLLNKTDHLSRRELAESVAFSTAVVRGALGADIPVFPVSARRALEARTANAGQDSTASGFAAFTAALQRFFANDSDVVWMASVRRQLARLLAECRLATELELKAIETPLAMLEANLHKFADAKAEALQSRADSEALLEADVHKLITERLDPDVATFKHALADRLDRAARDWLADAEAQHGTARHVALERRIVAEVRAAFDTWRPREDDGVGEAFDRVCERFQQRAQQLVDELLRYSAGLFSVRFDAVAAEPFRTARSGFYYKFWQEPTSLAMMRDALGDLMPGALGRGWLLKRARRRIAELVDMQSGRVHHDIEQRLVRAATEARRDILSRFDATLASIETAIAKGWAQKSRGEAAAAARRRDTHAQLAHIDAIASRTRADAAPLPSA